MKHSRQLVIGQGFGVDAARPAAAAPRCGAGVAHHDERGVRSRRDARRAPLAARSAGAGRGRAAARRAVALALLERTSYEQRMGAAVRSLVAEGFTHVAFGDLFLEDVRRYREDRLANTGLTPLFPLWKTKSTAELAREMIDGGLEARLTCVDPRVLDRVLRRPPLRRRTAARPASGRWTPAASAASSTRSRMPARCSARPLR